jgi:hypothetical protein
LDPAIRAHYESQLGHDFGAVRVHTDPRAAESAAAVDAVAYTVGRDVVFGRDRFQPGTEAGRCLLGHELGHVVQQRSAGTSIPACLSVAPAAGHLEREADALASASSSTDQAPSATSNAGVAVMRAANMVQTAPASDEAVIAEAKAMIGENRLWPGPVAKLLRMFAKGRLTAPQGHATLLVAGGSFTFKYIAASGVPGHPAIYGPYLAIGDDFAIRAARGDLRALAGELATVILQIDAGAPKAAVPPTPAAGPEASLALAALARRTATFRVILVMFSPLDGAALTSSVKGDLDAVASASADDKVKAGFEVVTRKALSADEVHALDARDLVLYVVDSSITESRLQVILRRHGIAEKVVAATAKTVMGQLASEDGANVTASGKTVSFANHTKATETLGSVDAVDTASGAKHAGRRFADLVLHELGHGLGLEHTSGIMARALDMNIYPKEQVKRIDYTAQDKAMLLRRLATLVKLVP